MSHSSSNREDYDDDDHYERAQPESPISEAVVHTIMTANRRIVKCFANAKWCTSDGYGDVVVAFAVDEDGAVTSASVTRGGNNSLNRCLPREIKELQFPPPSSNRAEELSYTFECR